MIRAGVDPGLVDEIMGCQTDDLWIWALDALVVYLRAAAGRTGDPIGIVHERVAARHGIELSSHDTPGGR